ncbi:hypothetical protein BFP97_06200 [Roseivirga sp. 4D4]|nr:hypothetical protein BFP97_06200 [Roseivirga sp. 4D4]
MNAVMYIGIFLAGFLSLLIFAKNNRTTHDHILVAWLIISALLLFSFYYDFNYTTRKYEALQLVGMVLPPAAAPILYFYVCSLVRSRPFKLRRYWFHFIPFFFLAGSMLYFYYNLEDSQRLVVDDGFIQMYGIKAFQMRNYGMIMAFFSFLYPVLSLYSLFRHKKTLTDKFSNLSGVNMDWLRNWIILSFIGFWLSFILIWSGAFRWIEFETSFKAVASLITLNIAIIGFYGLKQTSIFTNERIQQGAQKETSENKYERSRLTKDESAEILKKVQAAMESDKPYLDSQLSLESLAFKLGLSKHDLSQVINEQLGINFFTFVNEYRISEFKQLIQQPKNAHLTILGVALESGFNSKSSFNGVFKKLEGITPGAYKNSLKQSN